MEPLTLVIYIGLALLLLPFLIPIIEAIVTVVRTRLASTLPALTGSMRQAFAWVGRLLSEDGKLSLTETIEQVVGALVLVAAGGVFAATDLAVTLATLAPLIGLEVQPPQGLFSMFDQLLGLSLVLLAVVFGMILSDLLTWSFSSHFALIDRARPGAFFLTAVCFVLSLLVALALAVYRAEVIQPESGADAATATLTWLHTLPTFILLGLALLLFVGPAVTLLHLGTLGRAVVAGLAALGGVVCAMLCLLLGGLDLCLEIVVTGLQTVPGAFATLTEAGQASMGRARDRLRAAGGGLFAKLGRLVQPRAPRGPAGTPQTAAESMRSGPRLGVFNGQYGTPVASAAEQEQA